MSRVTAVAVDAGARPAPAEAIAIDELPEALPS